MRLTTLLILIFFLIALIITIAVVATSFSRVNDDEACQIFYVDGSKIVTKDTSGLVFVGPGQEKHCVSRATQHLTFNNSVTTGLQRPVVARSSEGLQVTLEVDIEWKFIPDQIDTTTLRVGYDSPETRLLMTSRAEIRNVASRFGITAFLTGSRQQIAEEIQSTLQSTLTDQDQVYVTIVKVNLLHIAVYEPFETKFQDVENKKLQQLVAKENIELIKLEEQRLNDTEYIAAVANRNKLLREAETETVQAQLEQSKLITESDTQMQQNLIAAESDRINRLIRARTRLDEVVAQRRLFTQEVSRKATANISLAETARQNMEVAAKGNISRALSNRTRDVTLAEIQQNKAIEGLVSKGIEQALEVFRVQLQANVTAASIDQDSQAAASETLVATRSKTSEFNMLLESLGLSEKALASILLYKSLEETNTTVLMDYTKQPLMLELAETAPDTVISSNGL